MNDKEYLDYLESSNLGRDPRFPSGWLIGCFLWIAILALIGTLLYNLILILL